MVQERRKHPLSPPTMPPEVATAIFCHLPSFIDVFALSSACCSLRSLWLKNVNPIYRSIAPREIPCESVARQTLIDQGGPSLQRSLSAKDVVHMLRNAHVVEKAILQFERQIVSRVKMYRPTRTEFYGPGGGEYHPPKLTRTEQARFIRSYYSLWSLMRLLPLQWDSRLQSTTSQELYVLHEMTRLGQNIGQEEEGLPQQNFLNEPPDLIDAMDVGPSVKREALQARIWEQIQYNSQHFYNRDAGHVFFYAKEEGFRWFIAIWDHWQPSLKGVICHRSVQLSPKTVRGYLWNDESDD